MFDRWEAEDSVRLWGGAEFASPVRLRDGIPDRVLGHHRE
jgi:hypothetical protein